MGPAVLHHRGTPDGHELSQDDDGDNDNNDNLKNDDDNYDDHHHHHRVVAKTHSAGRRKYTELLRLFSWMMVRSKMQYHHHRHLHRHHHYHSHYDRHCGSGVCQAPAVKFRID